MNNPEESIHCLAEIARRFRSLPDAFDPRLSDRVTAASSISRTRL